jgi:Holliday junction resolvasome RuvABC endonuclease subunit
MTIKLPGKDSQVYKEIAHGANLLVHGKVLAVDPSMGSHSSMPGWALYDAGELIQSGVLDINPDGTKWERLKEVYRQLRNMSLEHRIDACIYENVPVSAHAGRSQVSHASLLMAVGVTMSAVDARVFVGIPPIVWKCRASEGYIKGDEEDARQLGRIVIEMATEIIRKRNEGEK